MIKFKILLLYSLPLLSVIFAKPLLFNNRTPPIDRTAATLWVDSVMSKLTPDERIAQLLMVAAYSNKSLTDNAKVTELITKYNIGGIAFFQGGPVNQARYTNYWQSKAKTPLFIAIDGEWGLGMRLKDSTVSFPKQMTLGAIQDNKLIYKMGEEIANQCKRIGIQINFAPDADINSNPKNPVINYRSFGEDRNNVASKAIAYMKGMQDKGILATAKHFPGHGDTDKDSHKTLPTISHTLAVIDSVDLYPFKELIRNGISAIMIAHLFVPSLDTTSNQPSTLSAKIVRDLLINKMGFKGLIITDALGMKGISENSTPGELELKALLAGNDILLMSENVPIAIDYIKNAIASGLITQANIDNHCRKVLLYKYKAGLAKVKPIPLSSIYSDLNNRKSDMINQRLHEASITILKNNYSILPIKNLENQKIASVSFNISDSNAFDIMCDNYAPVQHFCFEKEFTTDKIPVLKQKLLDKNLIIITIHQTSNSSAGNYGFSDNIVAFINEIKLSKRVIINLLANPYSLINFSDTSKTSAIITGYQSNYFSQLATAEAIFGGISVNGKLPITASPQFSASLGFETSKIRFGYSYPEIVSIENQNLLKIDSIAQQGIKDSIYPGCQILIAKDGFVIYQKSFGFHTYERKNLVKNSDLYDLASLTKVVATTLSIMKLYEEGKISLDSSLRKYLPGIDSTNKANILIKDIMTHQARLQAWIPFYKKTLKNGVLDTNVYKKQKTEEFAYRVAENIYIDKNYKDSIFQSIIKSELRKSKNYTYSDLGFYLLKIVVENLVNENINKYIKENFYAPLGLTTLCYQPRNYFDLLRIVPSEIDTVFRKQILQGDVNDPGAAMLDGIGGHAGLFSNASDLAIILQMLLQQGEYGGERFFKPETVKKFTSYQFENNRRGLGFDKPVRDQSQAGPSCKESSFESFGHSGFTGTYIWADPKYNLVYIFLSNRTYPSSINNKLLSSGIRTEIQKIIYQGIEKK
ncbi:MAG: glycoside hydrolase family 3 N-terminal domain-containing protein [Bacteroidota bacterium]